MQIDIEITVEVEGTWYPGEKQSRDSPGEPASYEIDTIELNGLEIGDRLSADQLTKIAEEAYDLYIGELESDRDDYYAQQQEDRQQWRHE